MKEDKDGLWKTKMKLPPGSYEYEFFAESAWVENVFGPQLSPIPFGKQNFVISVR